MLVVLVLVVAGALAAARIRITSSDRDQLVSAAVDQVFFERHGRPVDPADIGPAIQQWHELYRRYTPEIVYHGADRATVTFRSGERIVAREEMRRYNQGGWTRPVPFRRRRFPESFAPPAIPPPPGADSQQPIARDPSVRVY